MSWHDFSNIRGAAIAQGLIEGAIIGIVLAVVFVLITRPDKFEYSTSTMTRSCGIIVSLALTCWAAGGLFGMLIAFVSPELALSRFPSTMDTSSSPYPIMWVGGSIMGLQLGGAASLIITALIIRKKAQKD